VSEIETDYLVVGAGASGMSFVDALIADSDADVVMVDRRHRPGGHWVDAYPFVRLHQPSAYYGVNSRVLGNERIDTSGPNAGFYERSTAAEICAYYSRVLEEHMLASGRVRFYGMSDYVGNGSDGYRFVSLLTGEPTTVKVRRKLIDATYIESSVPSKHAPSFEVDAGVRFVTPNELVNAGEPASGYTVLGAGKTSMDTCCWLLDQGVEPDRIRWIRPRDGWTWNRAFMQPLELVGSVLDFWSRFIEAAAQAERPTDIAHPLEDLGMFARIDPDVEPEIFRGATLSSLELEALRRIGNVVRLGKVRRIGTERVTLDEGTIPSDPGQVYVDCTAAGLKLAPARPIFEPGRLTLQMVTFGVAPWSAATLGFVEATREDDGEKNRLCPSVEFTGVFADIAQLLSVSLQSFVTRAAHADLAAWNDASRLNPLRGASDRMDDPRVQDGFTRMFANMEPAMANLERMLAEANSPAGA
jgi:hypothetical protein